MYVSACKMACLHKCPVQASLSAIQKVRCAELIEPQQDFKVRLYSNLLFKPQTQKLNVYRDYVARKGFFSLSMGYWCFSVHCFISVLVPLKADRKIHEG